MTRPQEPIKHPVSWSATRKRTGTRSIFVADFARRLQMTVSITRRAFISRGAALAVTAGSTITAPWPSEQKRLRMALVGTGDRGSFTWGQELVEGYSDVVEIVGLCDINPKRVQQAKKLI